MKVVIGLGNPGRKYEGTRHNVGFAVVDEVARRNAASKPKTAFQAELIEAELNGQKALLVRPQTFMNLSGQSALEVRDFYKVADEELLIVCDDFNLPLGKLRFRTGGTAGGQKGLADILSRLGTNQIARLRVGVGPVPPQWDSIDFVLGRFTKDELPEIGVSIVEAADAVVDWAAKGIEECMNRYN